MDRGDKELVERAQKKDQEAFEALVARYTSSLAAVAYDRLGNIADAQDAVQETLLTVHERLDSLRDINRFAAWLYEILRNVCARYMRDRKTAKRAVDVLLKRDAVGAGQTPLGAAMSQERIGALREAVASLSPVLREAIVLRHLGGADRKTAAALLGINVTALDKRLERGLAELRARLGRE